MSAVRSSLALDEYTIISRGLIGQHTNLSRDAIFSDFLTAITQHKGQSSRKDFPIHMVSLQTILLMSLVGQSGLDTGSSLL